MGGGSSAMTVDAAGTVPRDAVPAEAAHGASEMTDEELQRISNAA